ncbi:FtsH protease activity modulator HflK [Alphaproteobacteria bacterium]|nr:FtsH protease activity modulator HflK [Alphaproteobacteria bacterium]
MNKGPWGGGPSGGSNGQNSNDFEEILRKRQQQFQTIFGGRGGRGGGQMPSKNLFILGAIILLMAWGSTGFYRIGEKQQGAVLRFGKWTQTVKEPGLHYHLPSPIEEVAVVAVTERQVFRIPNLNEVKFMLTQDLNILDVNMTVHWYIKDLGKFLFRVKNPALTLEMAAESVMREIIARNSMESALTKGKDKIAADVVQLLQRTVDEYEIGISVERVNLERIDAPEPVIDAFRDVQSARADQVRMINEAHGYSDSIIHVAGGEAEKVIQEATAFRESIEAEAQGKASRFKQILTEYKKDPEHVRKRLYIEAMERIYSKTDKVILPPGQGAQGVLPYLPVDAFKRKRAASTEQATVNQGN